MRRKNLIIGSIILMLIMALSACTTKPSSNTSKNIKEKNAQTTKTVESTKETKQQETVKTENKVIQDETKVKKISEIINTPDIEKKEQSKLPEDLFGTPWQKSTNNNLSACISGKGEEAQEEGIGVIFVKDLSTNKIWTLELKNNEKRNTPKFLKWIDDENLLVIIGYGYGTVSKGGNLYIINVKTGDINPVYGSSDKKKQILSCDLEGTTLKLKMLIYTDDNFLNSNTESWKITSFNKDISSQMDVFNEEGTKIETIVK